MFEGVVLDKLPQLGFDRKQFGLHMYSLCSGGAFAAANAGVLDSLFKGHG